ncbi:type II toxin-antitoxin system HicB family antitoxin [Candidatus Parcubacteria bacterium]|nr:type II toxin-antitoxin system HicB family antitoxin [Candidatus Parcubacteria bacterium]
MNASKKEFLIQTKDGAFRVRIWWDKADRAYLVKGISLLGVVTFGRTLAEAKRMAREALELYCECAIDEN